MSRDTLSDDEYWAEFKAFEAEIDATLNIFTSLREFEVLTGDEATLNTINEDPFFWKLFRHSLQVALFVAVARIFDTNPGNRSVYRMLNCTLANVELFSRQALEKRRLETQKERPEWLDDFLARAWVPNDATHLRYLKSALKPHAERIKSIYLPIRHRHYAHAVADEGELIKLFSGTNREELGESLYFLEALSFSLFNLFRNGRKPDLRWKSVPDQHREIRDSIRKMLVTIGGGPL